MARDDYISQHWVHAFHLRQFYNSNDALWVFDKVEERIFETSTTNVANSDWFYDGKFEDPETEKWLQKVESSVTGPTGTYMKFIKLKSLSNSQITENDIYRMAYYMTVQELRTPAWRKVFRDIPEQLLEQYGDEMVDDLYQEVEEVLEEDRIRNIHVESMKSMAKKNAKFFAERMHWKLFENETGEPLWTSDNPVIRHNDLDLSPYGSHGNLSPGLQIYFPLSPDVMLALFDPVAYREEIGVMGDSIYDPEVLKFYRDLQVVDSSRQIFSPKAEFQQAEKRVKDSPEIASDDRLRIEMNPDMEDR